MIIISAGFDAHSRDPLGGLSEAEILPPLQNIVQLAKDTSSGGLVSLLEGGMICGGWKVHFLHISIVWQNGRIKLANPENLSPLICLAFCCYDFAIMDTIKAAGLFKGICQPSGIVGISIKLVNPAAWASNLGEAGVSIRACDESETWPAPPIYR